MKKEYYIFRHGQTFATKAGTGYGIRIFSASIIQEGIPAIKKMGEYLKNIPLEYQLTSNVRRCIQTTSIITEITGKSFEKDKRLNEYFLETFGYFRERITSVIKDIEKTNYEKIAICTHGGGIAIIKNLLINKKIKPSDIFSFPDPGRLIIIKDNKLEEINFN